MENAQDIDWIHLPPGTETICLWDSLHDGELISVRSNLLERVVCLEVEVSHLRDFHNLPDDLTFILQVESVRSVRVLGWAEWPGAFSIPPGTPPDKQETLVAEYHAKWREESQSWAAFEAALGRSDSNRAEIQDATLAIGPGAAAVALRLGLMLGGSYLELLLSAQRLRITRNDGHALDLDGFLRLGSSYWEHFASSRDEDE